MATSTERGADLLLRGGRVHTVDAQDRVAAALAIVGDRVLAIGTDAELEGLIDARTRVVDLGGRSVLPGFVEAHNHMGMYGTNQLGIDCKAPGMGSVGAIQEAVRARAAGLPLGSWVRAFGYDQTRLAERRHPTRWDLDVAAPNHPVLVTRTCGHIAVANSTALALAGVGDDTPDPRGGRYDRDDGRNAGVAYDAAQAPLLEASAHSVEEYKTALGITSRDWLAAGITSAQDAGAYDSRQISALQACVAEGSVRVRVYFTVWLALGITQGFTYLDSGLRTGFGDDRLKLGPFKIMTDGSSSGPTAGTRDDYTSEPGNRGILYYEQDQLDELVERAHVAGYQVTAHAVGDRAIEMMLNAYERVLARHPRANHRHRIEHCGICPPDLVERVKHLGIVPVIQPAFFWEFGDGYRANYGPRALQMFPARSFREAGIVAAGSSDAPVTRVHPLFGIQQALTRATAGGQTCGEAETISLPEAIRLFTYNGAYASFDEKLKGSLEPGKLADLVVLDGNVEQTPIEQIAAIPVAATLVGGETVHGGL